MIIQKFVNAVTSGQFDDKFRELYGNSEREIMRQRARYISAVENFSRTYPECNDIRIFSSPAGINIGGDTYHHGGFMLAAAVTCDIIAISGVNEDKTIRVDSHDFPCFEIALDGSFNSSDEKNKYSELIGKSNLKNGFNAYISTDIPSNHGFSSDTVLQKLIEFIVNSYNNAVIIDGTNNCGGNFFASGGFVSAESDGDPEPHINVVDCDFSSLGYSMCITNFGGNPRNSECRDDMTQRMEEAAKYFGKTLLCDVDEEEFYMELSEMRKKCSDLAVLSAISFFEEERLAAEEAKALEIGNTEEFFRLFGQSGKYDPNRSVSAAISVSRRFLGESGAARVLENEMVQAFVPSYLAADYAAEMDSVFGEKSCYISGVRSIFSCRQIGVLEEI